MIFLLVVLKTNFELDHYENQINTFDEFDYSIKESLSEFLSFDKKI